MKPTGPPYGLDHLPRHRWRSWDDQATHLPDHPAKARRIAADEPVVGLRAAVHDDQPYGLHQALREADHTPVATVTPLRRRG